MTIRALCGTCGNTLDKCAGQLKALEMLSKHYAHEVVIARDTYWKESSKNADDEIVAGYLLECLECEETLIYADTYEREEN
jgi:hypothetical protein